MKCRGNICHAEIEIQMFILVQVVEFRYVK
jgi:hypothetical protein